jgi:hypothetical protein
MNTIIVNTRHRLPSPDAAAFVVAVAASALSFVWPPLQLLVPLAVFAPSLLREVGLLGDDDEYARAVAYRAGFHALLVSALLVFGTFAAGRPGGLELDSDLLTGETLRKVLLLTFVVSYLLQYWGARGGAFRILLGLATLFLVAAARIVPGLGEDAPVAGLALAAVVAACVGLAFAARRWPRTVGAVLLLLCIAMVVDGLRYTVDPMTGAAYAARALPAIMLQAFIVPGAVAVALLRQGKEEE